MAHPNDPPSGRYRYDGLYVWRATNNRGSFQQTFKIMLASEIGRLKDPIDNHISDTVSYIA